MLGAAGGGWWRSRLLCRATHPIVPTSARGTLSYPPAFALSQKLSPRHETRTHANPPHTYGNERPHDRRPFFSHVASWWAVRQLPNVMLVHFSALRADLPGEARRIANFLDIAVPDDK